MHDLPADDVGGTASEIEARQLAAMQAELIQKARDLEEREKTLTQLCQTVDSLASKVNDLHQHTVAQNRGDIAKLAVEIARKILRWKIDQGDYAIQEIIEEALKQAPTRQKLVVRVNPEDLTRCQQHQEENPDGQFAEVEFVADWGIAPADCLIETPKGVVRSFVAEHLDHIGEALERAQ
jgi:flagellar biosynthesis/type III secretory pathway protein FliH